VYGPVRTVVWEGRSRKAPPYPDYHRLGQAWEARERAGYPTIRLHDIRHTVQPSWMHSEIAPP
jgi:hypothetical protein